MQDSVPGSGPEKDKTLFPITGYMNGRGRNFVGKVSFTDCLDSLNVLAGVELPLNCFLRSLSNSNSFRIMALTSVSVIGPC